MALTKTPIELSSTPSIVDGGNATAITIDSSENVGIGTSSPSSQLEIDESGSGDATIKVGNAQNVQTTNVGKQGATAYGATAAGAAFLYTYDNDISIMSDGGTGSIKFTTGGNTQKMELDASGNLGIGGVGNISPYGIRFAINGTGTGGAGLYFGSGVIIPTDNTPTISDATVDLGASNYRFKDLYLSGEANVGSIVQTGSSSSLIADFNNTNTSGYGMRITTYSSGVEYALAVDSYGGGYSRDFVIGVNGYIYSPPTYALTTGSSANMFVATDGSFQRSTSSLRYKNTVNDATHGLTELLTLRPVTYKGNNDGDTVFGGLIAEEVHDAGLTEFVQYNEEDQPDALAYGNMVSLCIKAIQELKEELNTATARITELENN